MDWAFQTWVHSVEAWTCSNNLASQRLSLLLKFHVQDLSLVQKRGLTRKCAVLLSYSIWSSALIASAYTCVLPGLHMHGYLWNKPKLIWWPIQRTNYSTEHIFRKNAQEIQYPLETILLTWDAIPWCRIFHNAWALFYLSDLISACILMWGLLIGGRGKYGCLLESRLRVVDSWLDVGLGG